VFPAFETGDWKVARTRRQECLRYVVAPPATTPPSRRRLNGPALAAIFFAACILNATARAQTNIPTAWIDPDTGHRVVRLSTEPGQRKHLF